VFYERIKNRHKNLLALKSASSAGPEKFKKRSSELPKQPQILLLTYKVRHKQAQILKKLSPVLNT
jgi:hypothetical protein